MCWFWPWGCKLNKTENLPSHETCNSWGVGRGEKKLIKPINGQIISDGDDILWMQYKDDVL